MIRSGVSPVVAILCSLRNEERTLRGFGTAKGTCGGSGDASHIPCHFIAKDADSRRSRDPIPHDQTECGGL